MKRNSAEGLVYYLLDATRLTQRVKIGYTTRLTERIAAVAADTMMWQRPIVLALETGGFATEQKRHRQFRELRIRGEWFEYGPALQAHLRRLPHPIGWLRDHPELWQYAAGWQTLAGRLKEIPEPEPDPPVDDPVVPTAYQYVDF